MRETISWIKEAISSKDIVKGMNYYNVGEGEIRATNGNITAGHPWEHTDHAFLVPGDDFEKVLDRMKGELKVEYDGVTLKIKAGRLKSEIQTLQRDLWQYPGVDDVEWLICPDNLLSVFERLIPFVSENGSQNWSVGIALQGGWAFATNNVSLAGVQYQGAEDIDLLIPIWAVKFMVAAKKPPIHWAWTKDYLAFEWENGAWLRSNLLDGVFPPQAVKLIKEASVADTTTEVTDEFKDAFNRVCVKDDQEVIIGPKEMISTFGNTVMSEEFEMVDVDHESRWSVKHLRLVMSVATWWSPGDHPRPCAFQGEGICGLILGKK